MPNEIDDYTLLVIKYSSEMRILNTVENFDPENEEVIIKSRIDIESDLIRRDLFDKLSEEAKSVIRFILNAPDECTEILKAEKYNKISVMKFRNLLKNAWNGKAEKITREIKLWLKELARR